MKWLIFSECIIIWIQNQGCFILQSHICITRWIGGCKLSGVKRIRVHDLRHSHVAYLIEQGFSPVVIADRLEHESISITLNYAHLYPSKQLEIVNIIEKERN